MRAFNYSIFLGLHPFDPFFRQLCRLSGLLLGSGLIAG